MNNAKVDILFIISLITRMLILFLMLEILVEMMDFLVTKKNSYLNWNP
jgi:hypothetical protein